MEMKDSSEFLRALRKSRDMTQMELASDICSVKELQRIEKGIASPNMFIYKKLLTRLGVDLTRYIYSFSNVKEQLVYNKILEIRNLLFDSNYIAAEEKFNYLKKQDYFDENDLFMHQFALTCKAHFQHGIYQNIDLAMQTIYEAINLTITNFNLKYIDKYILIPEEYNVISILAILHKELGDIEKAISILMHLKNSANQKCISVGIKYQLLPTILYNLSKYLGQNEDYIEALKICDEGINACIDACTFRCLGELYYNKAVDLYFLNDISGSKMNFKYAYDTFVISGNTNMLEVAIKNAMEGYGISIVDIKL